MDEPKRQSTAIPALSFLTLAMHANRSCYALLLGSGLSRAAGVPTGNEVVVALVRRVAQLEGSDAGASPLDWFESTYGERPTYSVLMGRIGTSEEIRGLLRPYFEATPEERDQGLKTPTKAHRAIARLVLAGHIRVIVTTNFDRLLEQALADEQIQVAVISTPDQAQGATPIAHSRCTIVKLHGDYLDSPLKNLPEELESYAPVFDRLLDQIVDEYGLLVCGWSGENDQALRAAIERCPTRRYWTVWVTTGPLTEAAGRLVDIRRAQVLHTGGADEFFSALEEKLIALDDLTAGPPLSTELAIETIKRYLPDPRNRIRLHDLVHETVEAAISQITSDSFPTKDKPPLKLESADVPHFRERLLRYETVADTCSAAMAVGCFWDTDEGRLWIRTLERFLNHAPETDGLTAWVRMQLYPAYILLYTGGISSLAGGHTGRFYSLLTECDHRSRFGIEPSWRTFVRNTAVLDSQLMEDLVSQHMGGKPKLSRSHYLLHKIRPHFLQLIPDDLSYTNAFDRFEYLAALVQADLSSRNGEMMDFWPGRFAYQIYNYEPTENAPTVADQVSAEVESQEDEWPLLKCGAFHGSATRFREVADEVTATVKKWQWLSRYS